MSTTLVPLSAMFGSLLGGVLAKYGRKKALIIIDIIGIIGVLLCILSLLTKGITPMYLGRVIIGLTVGLNTTLVPLYIKEMSPSEMSGKTGSFNQLFVTLGVFCTSLFGTTLGDAGKNNRIPALYIMFMFPIVLLVFRTFMLLTRYDFETPNYYMIKRNFILAKEVLERLYTKKEARKQLEELKEEIGEGEN